MNLDTFVRSRSPAWRRLDELVHDARRRPERLGAERVRTLGTLYRETAADLALARRRFRGDPVVGALEQRVARARHLVYDAPTRREAFLAFLARDYWTSVRARWLPVLIAAVLLLGSAGLAAVWADADPGEAAGVAPGAYAAVTHPRPRNANLGLPASERSSLAAQIFTNNIQVTFLSFAAGLAAGIGTAALLLWNGLQLGVVAGLAVGSGNGRVFTELVIGHGLLELSCLIVTAGAALQMGWALVEPGRKTRAAALGAEARRAIRIVLGTAPWLVLAGLIEGLLTPAGLGLPAITAIGVAAAGAYWTLVLTLGRVRRAPAPSP